MGVIVNRLQCSEKSCIELQSPNFVKRASLYLEFPFCPAAGLPLGPDLDDEFTARLHDG